MGESNEKEVCGGGGMRKRRGECGLEWRESEETEARDRETREEGG